MNLHDAIDLILSNSEGCAVNFYSLKKLYKRAAFNCHPDRVDSDTSTLTMKSLNEAWDYLADKEEQVNRVLIRLETTSSALSSSDEDIITGHELTQSNLPAFESRSSLIQNAFTIIDSENWNSWLGARFKTIYFSKYQIRLHMYSSSIHITSIADALDARKKCEHFTIQWGLGCDSEGLSYFLDWVNKISPTACISAVIAQLRIATYQEQFNGYLQAKLTSELTVTKYTIKSGQVFSPFKLHKLKPLTEIPKNIRALHLIKMIANGQYRQLHRSQYLTDDYAYDAATNFGAKVYENPFPLLVSLIENRSGGFHIFYSGHGVYSFGDHMNDSKSIVPVIDNRFPAVDLLINQSNKHNYLQ